MNLSNADSLIDNLERAAERVQLYRSDSERCIAWCIDAIYDLAKRGDDERKMQMVGLEYRARLVLERLEKMGLN